MAYSRAGPPVGGIAVGLGSFQQSPHQHRLANLGAAANSIVPAHVLACDVIPVINGRGATLAVDRPRRGLLESSFLSAHTGRRAPHPNRHTLGTMIALVVFPWATSARASLVWARLYSTMAICSNAAAARGSRKS